MARAVLACLQTRAGETAPVHLPELVCERGCVQLLAALLIDYVGTQKCCTINSN